MPRKSLSLPFIVTLGVSSVGCGSTVSFEADGAGGGGGTGGDTSSSSATGGTGGTGGQTTSSGSSVGGFGANPPMPECPPEAPNSYTQCDLPPDQVCTYDVPCQSGTQSLSFVCDGIFVFADQACEQPYDSCPGTEYYCDGSWWMPEGSNPPSPCPVEQPATGSSCFPGGMGGDWENCGYACDGKDASTGWTVVSCAPDSDGYSWQPDTGCTMP